MSLNVKIAADISGFVNGVREGQNVMKGLNAEMKAAESEFKATGNAEQLTANKTRILNDQLNTQKSIVDQAKSALKAMKEAGIDPTDAAYQKLNVQMLNAQAGMNEAQAALNGLGASAQEAATGADQLTQSVNNIGKKISLDQVITGIGKITDGLENAARKAVQLGEQIWSSIMDSAKWADDTATQALMFGIDLDTYQRMQKLVTNGMDTSVEAILKAQTKLNKGIGDGSKSVKEALSELGISVTEWRTVAGESGSALVTKDSVDLFWEAGKALMAMDSAFDKESTAQTLFGRSWKELVPLFKQFATQDDYNKALEQVKVNSEEDVNALAELNDKVGELKGNLETLGNEIWATMAPALTNATEALNGLLESVMDYLQTEDGQKLLQTLGDTVASFFDGLTKMDPENVVQNFQSVFEKLTGSLKWISENSEGVLTGIRAIFDGWAALKLTGGALQLANLINGIRGLTGGGAATAAAQAGAAFGSSWGGAFASAVMKAAPWLAGGYIGAKMIEANMNDENLNAIYGQNGGEGGIIDTMSDQAAKAAKEYWDVYQEVGSEAAMNARDKLFDIFTGEGYENAEQGVSLIEQMFDNMIDENDIDGMGEKLRQRWSALFDSNPVKTPVTPEVPNNAASLIAAQIGTVTVPVVYVDTTGPGYHPDRLTRMGTLPDGSNANGIWSVPYDGYLAELHRGERVIPAREVAASRNFSSNLYIESMYMTNGQDAEGLAAAMAAAQRRTMSGYGS